MSRYPTIAPFMIIALAAALAGCATQAQRQSQAMAENIKSAEQTAATCLLAAYNSPDFAPVRPHLPPDIRDATLEQMTDSSLVTDAEIHALLRVHPQFHACRRAFLTQISRTNPSYAVVYASLYTKIDNEVIALIQKKQNWGDYVRVQQKHAAEFVSQLNQASQEVAAELERSNSEELARRQAAANAMVNYIQTQESIDAMYYRH